MRSNPSRMTALRRAITPLLSQADNPPFFAGTRNNGGMTARSDTVSERTGSPDVHTCPPRLQYAW